MKIKKITKESYETLLFNLNHNFSEVNTSYLRHSHNFIPLTNAMSTIEDGAYEIEDSFYNSVLKQISLKTDGNGTYDFENASIIYEMFPDLTPMEANDERFWTRLTHDHFHKYVIKRWMDGKGSAKDVRKIIKQRFFFEGSGQQARVRNAISRLWWIAHLTVNHEAEEEKKWELTKAICESQDFITSILERSLGSYTDLRTGILEYYSENKHKFGSNKSKTIQGLLKDLNNYGGVSLLAMMTKESAKNLVGELIQSYGIVHKMYTKKISNQDIERTPSINVAAAEDFFGLNMENGEITKIKFHYKNKEYLVELHKRNTRNEYRFFINHFKEEIGYEEDYILEFTKNSDGYFLNVLTPGTKKHDSAISKLDGKMHLIQ